MEKRKLGTSGLLVSPITLGGNVFGWTLDEAGSFKILDSFAHAGFNFIDTADSYSRFVPGNHYSLSGGFLTGKYRSEADPGKSQRGLDIKKYLDERGLKILNAMDRVAAEQNVQLSQIAIAWLLHKSFITSAIASATKEKQLNELIHATNLELTDWQMAKLDEASA